MSNQYLSASRLTLYSDCGLKYKFNYIDKLGKPAKSIHLAYGSAVHKGLEVLNLSLLKEKAHIEDIFQAYEDEWHKELNSMGIEKDFLMWKLYFHGLNTLSKYYENNLDYEVISAEQRFNVPIIYPDGTEDKEHSMSGIIDAIIKRKSNLIILDYKTAKEAFNRFKLNTSIQLAIYSYAVRYMLSKGLIKGINKKKEDYIAYYMLLKDYDTLDGDIKLQQKKITDEHIKRMFYIIKQSKQGINNEIFLPNYSSLCHWCFTGNTLVSTPKGRIPIKNIRYEDEVFSYENGKIIISKVLHKFKRKVAIQEICKIVIGNKTFYCTKNHRFYVKDKKWVEASSLKIGDICFDMPERYISKYRMKNNNPMYNEQTQEKMVNTTKERRKKGIIKPYKVLEKNKKLSSQRMKNNNPMKDPKIVEKCFNTLKEISNGKRMSELEKRFNNNFVDFPIYYTGNYVYKIKSPTGKLYFPDFKIIGKRKVIEIYDTRAKYHTKQGLMRRDNNWEKERKTGLAECGYDVLFLTEKNINNWREKIIPFIYNGKVVKEVKMKLSKQEASSIDGKSQGPRKTHKDDILVYNIETKTKNYYVDNILVHNCEFRKECVSFTGE